MIFSAIWGSLSFNYSTSLWTWWSTSGNLRIVPASGRLRGSLCKRILMRFLIRSGTVFGRLAGSLSLMAWSNSKFGTFSKGCLPATDWYKRMPKAQISTFEVGFSFFITSGEIYCLVVNSANVELYTSKFVSFLDRPKSVIFRTLNPFFIMWTSTFLGLRSLCIIWLLWR